MSPAIEPVPPGSPGAVAQAVSSPVAWWVDVGGYGFLVQADEVEAVDDRLEPCPLPHAPAWVAGMVHARGRLCGLVDFGRFLGVSTSRPGPILWPRAAISPAWALRVHAVQGLSEFEWAAVKAGLEASGPASPSDHDPMLQAGSGPEMDPAARPEWTQRQRPGFVSVRCRWVTPLGVRRTADLLSLAAWAAHPRLKEHGG